MTLFTTKDTKITKVREMTRENYFPNFVSFVCFVVKNVTCKRRDSSQFANATTAKVRTPTDQEDIL